MKKIVIKTEDLKAMEANMPKIIVSALPGAISPRDREKFIADFMKKFLALTKDSDEILAAAAAHRKYAGVSGKAIELTKSTIESVLSSIRPTNSRIKSLMDPN